ncbi:hypothetical protein BC629DRAFT_980508 [Irpex lacteus]|nr:hypothetical protein BC629DRAFT_980508 [Irpex lacteus]
MGKTESRGLGQLQFDMTRAHSTHKLGYDRIVELLADPPMNDLANFLGYCSVWAAAILEHHDSEELIVFPFLNQKMDFSGEAEEHKVIHDILEELISTINAAKDDHKKFKPADMIELMKKFRGPLFNHLDAEVQHISAEKFRVAGIDEAELAAMQKRMVDHAVATSDPWTTLPYMRGHTPPEYKDTWPPLPWFLRKVAIPYVLARKHAGYWKYCPYALS